jgi:hypothetical protein
VALRGSFHFDVSQQGDLSWCPDNFESLRSLWLSRTLVDGETLGPGDPGDFDHGAWHVACHLLAAGGVRRASDGRVLWLEVSYDAHLDEYYASVSAREGGTVHTEPIESAIRSGLLTGSTLMGFVEGNSTGHISARGVRDAPERFNRSPRQEYDRDVDSPDHGGKVWEHWCTTRDIRPSERTSSSVLRAYVILAAALGERFAAAVARGRRDYAHPQQLGAMVVAGLVSASAAACEMSPHVLTPQAERLLLEASPDDALTAVEALSWEAPPRYYMFRRRIDRWSDAATVRAALRY